MVEGRLRQFNFRLSPAEAEILQRYADLKLRTKSDVLRQLVRELEPFTAEDSDRLPVAIGEH